MSAPSTYAQVKVSRQKLSLTYDSIHRLVKVQQDITLHNINTFNIDSLIILNWANAYQNKRTELGKFIIENYNLNFHFASSKQRGRVIINQIELKNNTGKFVFHQLKSDVFIIKPENSLKSGDSLTLHFDYDIQLPNAKFTGYGIDKNDDILLQNFYFQPVPFQYQSYSEKGIDDYPALPANFELELNDFPPSKNIITNLQKVDNQIYKGQSKDVKIVVSGLAYDEFKYKKKHLILPSDVKIDPVYKTLIVQKIIDFLHKNTGTVNKQFFLITPRDIKNNKVYGLDLLPKFLNPYDQNLIWEIKTLHLLTAKYLSGLQIDRRRHPWVLDGLANFFEYDYLKKYHPDLKLLGKAANYKLVKFYYASQVKMSEKYPWLYLYVARMSKDQPLQMALDSFSNFNRNVMMPYKTALGIKMLKDRQNDSIFKQRLKHFFKIADTKPVSQKLFVETLVDVSQKKWFLPYIQTTQKYDYKLKSVKQKDKRLIINVKNKRHHLLPLTLFGIKNDSIQFSKQLPLFKNDTLISLNSSKNLDFIGFNYFNDYPELQSNNNYKRPGFHLFEKPLQIRPYKDFDNPLKSQIFINPFFEYNYYDGIIIGSQIFNESVLHNHFIYVVTPGFGTKNASLTGSFSIVNTNYLNRPKFYALRYGFGFKYFHYNHGLVYRKYNPAVELKFRNPYLRKREESYLKFQYMYIDKDPIGKTQDETEKYGVFNVKFSKKNVNVIKDFFYSADLQLAKNFGKMSAMLRYRFLTDKNRQWDFRIYAGKFLYNRTQTDYFSFALDRPTDYLFQYHYYGRSESTGIFHQQFVWAEGGFKTFFDNQYSNDFIISHNINIGIWKWFNLYGDLAWLKPKQHRGEFFYDSGMRVNLVQDYFEVFFPIYSKKGWEIKQADYLSKIRIVFTMDLNGLFKMFERGWY